MGMSTKRIASSIRAFRCRLEKGIRESIERAINEEEDYNTMMDLIHARACIRMWKQLFKRDGEKLRIELLIESLISLPARVRKFVRKRRSRGSGTWA